MNGITFTFDVWQVVQVVVAVVLPVLVGLVTKLYASGGLKAALLAALSLATSIGTEALAAHQAGTTYDVGQALVLGLGTFVIAVATHYGLWKPAGVAEAVGAVGTKIVTDDADVPPVEQEIYDSQAQLDAALASGEIVEPGDDEDADPIEIDDPDLPGVDDSPDAAYEYDYEPRH
ncbi:hypothetical protein NQ036_06735 [Brevibacterium sp. 91QC2O2]|uniref:hypothetical protein n=1 Tax=Brevibacterium sp. 91QC2O2 TaxID=2968458 RepID=UPI00211BCBF0|nr:hypothetical protein [Brevibacterium sp. 91QC2O2]MCQ9367939.1 hypothetical protein [Brevibacterium sp. 91QC2O2]